MRVAALAASLCSRSSTGSPQATDAATAMIRSPAVSCFAVPTQSPSPISNNSICLARSIISKKGHVPVKQAVSMADWLLCTTRLPAQVVGFVILVSGTSVYNEILRTFLPAPHRHRRRHRRRQQLRGETGTGEGGLEEGDLGQPLLGAAEGGEAGLAAGREQRPGVVRFAPGTAKAEEGQGVPVRGERRPPLPARPRPIDRSYTMARCAGGGEGTRCLGHAAAGSSHCCSACGGVRDTC